MREREIINEIMRKRNFTYATLSDKCGYSTASGISNKLSRPNGMRLDTFLKMLNALDCELVIRSKLTDKSEWKIPAEEN